MLVDWEFDSYQISDLVVMKILVNSEPVDALVIIVHRSKAESRGRALHCIKRSNSKTYVCSFQFKLPLVVELLHAKLSAL